MIPYQKATCDYYLLVPVKSGRVKILKVLYAHDNIVEGFFLRCRSTQLWKQYYEPSFQVIQPISRVSCFHISDIGRFSKKYFLDLLCVYDISGR